MTDSQHTTGHIRKIAILTIGIALFAGAVYWTSRVVDIDEIFHSACASQTWRDEAREILPTLPPPHAQDVQFHQQSCENGNYESVSFHIEQSESSILKNAAAQLRNNGEWEQNNYCFLGTVNNKTSVIALYKERNGPFSFEARPQGEQSKDELLSNC